MPVAPPATTMRQLLTLCRRDHFHGTTHAIDVGWVSLAPPHRLFTRHLDVWQFSYASKLTPGAAYAVRLHFAEYRSLTPGGRVFNVANQRHQRSQ